MSIVSSLAEWALRALPAREAGRVVERVQMALAGDDPRIGAYALECNNPQAICFLIDVYADLQALFKHYPRMGEVRLLDIGPAFGGSAGLLAGLHRSHFLGPKLTVSALDITPDRERFIAFSYPYVEFMMGTIESLPAGAKWDLVYCSNAIEHMEEPEAFIESVLAHTTGFAVFLAPYKEAQPMSLDHKSRIDEDTFTRFRVEKLRVFESAAWPTTADGTARQQILAILRPEH